MFIIVKRKNGIGGQQQLKKKKVYGENREE